MISIPSQTGYSSPCLRPTLDTNALFLKNRFMEWLILSNKLNKLLFYRVLVFFIYRELVEF